jgi:hypothetical protein
MDNMERRKQQRSLAWMTGRITTAAGAPAIDCAILDCSESGACVLVPKVAEIPATFTLTLDQTNKTFVCTIRWATGNRIGVSLSPAEQR